MPGYIKPPSNQYIYSSSTVDGARIMTAASDYGFRNKIINGDFGVWQRGTSFTNPVTGSGYTADRWFLVYDGSGATRTISQQNFTTGVGTNPTNAINGRTHFLRFNQSVAGSGGNYNLIEQRIEGASLAGQTVTFSFWAKAAATITLPQIDYEYTIGATNTSANVTSNISVGTSWQKYIYTFTINNFSGLTPNNTSDYVGIRIWVPLNTTFTLDLWGLQLEPGAISTPFESRPPQVELAMCQRYFQSSFPYGTAPQNNIAPGILFTQSANGNLINGMQFPVQMRATPSITTYNPYANNSSWRQANGSTDVGISSISLNGGSGISFIATSGVTITTSNSVHGHWAAVAEF
jgi:hypothetical protein